MALAWVFLNATTLRSTQGNQYFGLAIGFVTLACLLTLGEVSRGAFNPALAIGYAMVGGLAWGDLWLYLIGNLLGAAAAVTIFAVVHEEK
jgi:aquaporin Z